MFRRKRSSQSAGFDCLPSRGVSNCVDRKRWTGPAAPAACSAWRVPVTVPDRGRRTAGRDWWRCRPNTIYVTICSAGKRLFLNGGCCSWSTRGVPPLAEGPPVCDPVLRHYTEPIDEINKQKYKFSRSGCGRWSGFLIRLILNEPTRPHRHRLFKQDH